MDRPITQQDYETTTSGYNSSRRASKTRDEPSSTQHKPSRFLLLPAEVRNEIYLHLFGSTVPLIKPAYHLPGILHSNRQIHQEALGLYYSTSTFRCLDEGSTIRWMCCLSQEKLALLKEVRYDTRWIIFQTPLIPVRGAELLMWAELVRKLKERGIILQGEKAVVGQGVMRVSFYAGKGGEVLWTDKMGLIEAVQNV